MIDAAAAAGRPPLPWPLSAAQRCTDPCAHAARDSSPSAHAPQPARRRAAPLALFAASSLALTLAGGATLRSALLVEQRTASCPGCKNTATGDLCAPCTLDGDCASADLPAVQGYDVVSFHSLPSGECGAAGSPAITATYGGYVWRFGSEANRDAFRADPAKYAPKYGGFCALGVAARLLRSGAALLPRAATRHHSS